MMATFQMYLPLLLVILSTSYIQATNLGSEPLPVDTTLGHAPNQQNKCILTSTIVNCSDLRLEKFPETVQMGTSVLDLSRNHLESLQSEQAVFSLITLWIHGNNLVNTNGVFFNRIFPQLEELDLSLNKLTELPSHLPNTLRKLDLGRNYIRSILALELQSIEELYLTENKIDGSISVCNEAKSGSKCTGRTILKKLDLSKNHIDDLELNGFSGLKLLQVLSLADNKLSQLSKNMFTKLSSLTLLDLSRNVISSIADNTFEDLHALKYLYLRGNKLLVLPNHLPLLEWFDASHNEIRSLNETMKTALYPIEMANLGHNPFHCDCKLLWLKEWYDRREYIIDYSEDINPNDYIPMCATPSDLYGEHWSMLSDDVFRCDIMEDSIELPLKRDINQHIPGYSEIDDLKLDPYAITGENPKYIQSYDLHVQVRSVMSGAVTLEWRAPSHYTNLVIQYFKAQSEVETTLFSQVQASQGHFVLRNLESDSAYMICVMPKSETLSLTAPLDDCLRIKTPKNLADEPRSIFSGLLSFHIDHTMDSKFKLIFGCFFVSIVIVASGLLLAEGVLRLFYESSSEADKEHAD